MPDNVTERDKISDVREESIPSSTSAESVSQRCGIRECRKVVCALRSHQAYVAARRHALRFRKILPTKHDISVLQTDSLPEWSTSRIERLLAQTFPSLTLDQESSTTFRELAHHYFVVQTDRLIQIHSPHYERKTYKSTMRDYTISNDIFCLCLAANAKTHMLMRAHAREPDHVSNMVYASTAAVLRQKLNHFKPTDLDWLLVLVVALVGFDLAFDRTESLRAHHEALKQLVSIKGGIQTVGHILPYVLNTDRITAVVLGRPPHFPKSPIMPQPSVNCLISCPYGGAFRHHIMADQIDQSVIDYSLEELKLIWLMEEYHISLVPNTTSATDLSVLPYFLHLRDRLAAWGACLHADYHENQNMIGCQNCKSAKDCEKCCQITKSKSRCVLLVVLIIEYVVAHANYYTNKPRSLANQAKAVLERQPQSEWIKNRDMLLWILFTLSVVTECWEHSDWAEKEFKHQVSIKYSGKSPPPNWINAQLELMKQYLWSTTFDTMFVKFCLKLRFDDHE